MVERVEAAEAETGAQDQNPVLIVHKRKGSRGGFRILEDRQMESGVVDETIERSKRAWIVSRSKFCLCVRSCQDKMQTARIWTGALVS